MSEVIESNRIDETITSGEQGVPSTDVATILNQILTNIQNIAKALNKQNAGALFEPLGFTATTSPTPNSAIPLVGTEILVSHFVIQNTGSANISIGNSTIQPIVIAPQAMFFYTFSLANYQVDLSKLYVSSASASQGYSVLYFDQV